MGQSRYGIFLTQISRWSSPACSRFPAVCYNVWSPILQKLLFTHCPIKCIFILLINMVENIWLIYDLVNLKVATSPHHAHGNHLDDHLPKEVEVDHVINHLYIICSTLKDTNSKSYSHHLAKKDFPKIFNFSKGPWFQFFCSTFSIWHFLSQNPESSQGWYIPKVTQLIMITVIVNRSK